MARQVLTNQSRFVMLRSEAAPFVQTADCASSCCSNAEWSKGLPCVGSDLEGCVDVYFLLSAVLGCNVVSVTACTDIIDGVPTGRAVCYQVDKNDEPWDVDPEVDEGIFITDEIPDDPTATCCGCVPECETSDLAVFGCTIPEPAPGDPDPDDSFVEGCCCNNDNSYTAWDRTYINEAWVSDCPDCLPGCVGQTLHEEIRYWGSLTISGGVITAVSTNRTITRTGLTLVGDHCEAYSEFFDVSDPSHTDYMVPLCPTLSVFEFSEHALFRSFTQCYALLCQSGDVGGTLTNVYPFRSYDAGCGYYTGESSNECTRTYDGYTFREKTHASGWANSTFSNDQCNGGCGTAEAPPVIQMIRQTEVGPSVIFQYDALMDLMDAFSGDEEP